MAGIVIIVFVLILIHEFGLLSILVFLVGLLVFLVGLVLSLAFMGFFISLGWDIVLAYQVRKGNRVKLNSENIKIFQQMMFNRTPLIGSWLQRSSVLAFSHDNTPEAIRTLAEAVTRSNNKQLCSMVLNELHRLTKQSCTDEVCGVWATTRHPDLASLLTQHGWIASTPADVRLLSALKVGRLEVLTRDGVEVVRPLLQACRDKDSIIAKGAGLTLKQLKTPEAKALFLFLTEQWDKYESLDFNCTLLQSVYKTGDKELREQIAEKARQSGRLEFIEVIAGGKQKRQLAEMTEAEWKVVLAVLSQNKQWEKMWWLAQAAPTEWSLRLLQQLNLVEWFPREIGERTGFEELLRLAQGCSRDVPKFLAFVSCQATILNDIEGCLAFSHDGKLLASGDSNGIVHLFSLPSGRRTETILAHPGNPVQDLAFSPSNQMLASTEGREVKLWSLPGGEELKKSKPQFLKNLQDGEDGKIFRIAFSPNSMFLAAGIGLNNNSRWSPYSVHIYNWHVLRDSEFRGGCGSFIDNTLSKSEVHSLVFSPDSESFVSGYDNRLGRCGRSDTHGKEPEKYRGIVKCLAFSPDGKSLLTSQYSTVYLWKFPFHENYASFEELIGHRAPITCLVFSFDGQFFASGSSDKTVRLWSCPEKQLLKILKGYTAPICHLAFSPDEQILISASRNKTQLTVQPWQFTNLNYLVHLPIKQTSVEDIKLVQETLRDGEISSDVRGWLEFLFALMRWRQRFDIEVEDAPQRIDAGEFDIEIEG